MTKSETFDSLKRNVLDTGIINMLYNRWPSIYAGFT